jgi:hypothetical protein
MNNGVTHMSKDFRATRQGNIVEVYDYRCAWSIFYRVTDGKLVYHSGGVDTAASRQAARESI